MNMNQDIHSAFVGEGAFDDQYVQPNQAIAPSPQATITFKTKSVT